MVKGPKGNLEMKVAHGVKVELSDKQIKVSRKNDQKNIKALHGLVRNLIVNMVKGVTEGWSKSLELSGVGFRAQSDDGRLTLFVGYSHPVEISAPAGVSFEVTDNTKIKVSGIDKQLVGQIAADIRVVRVPDVYKGKGIKYEGEYIRKKLGKTGKVGVAGAVGGAK